MAKKPKSSSHVPRPQNSFFFFKFDYFNKWSEKARAPYAQKFGRSAKAVGAAWKDLKETNQPAYLTYVRQAEEESKPHAEKYPNYVYHPKPRNDLSNQSKGKGAGKGKARAENITTEPTQRQEIQKENTVGLPGSTEGLFVGPIHRQPSRQEARVALYHINQVIAGRSSGALETNVSHTTLSYSSVPEQEPQSFPSPVAHMDPTPAMSLPPPSQSQIEWMGGIPYAAASVYDGFMSLDANTAANDWATDTPAANDLNLGIPYLGHLPNLAVNPPPVALQHFPQSSDPFESALMHDRFWQYCFGRGPFKTYTPQQMASDWENTVYPLPPFAVGQNKFGPVPYDGPSTSTGV